MEIVTWLKYYFYPLTGPQAVEIVEDKLAHGEKFQKINEYGHIDVCVHPSCPGFVIKFGDPARAQVAALYRKVIQENNLYLLEVPQSWPFSEGVVAEKKDLYSQGLRRCQRKKEDSISSSFGLSFLSQSFLIFGGMWI